MAKYRSFSFHGTHFYRAETDTISSVDDDDDEGHILSKVGLESEPVNGTRTNQLFSLCSKIVWDTNVIFLSTLERLNFHL